MKNKIGIMVGVLLFTFGSILNAQSTLEVVRKIKVDDDGPAGASDGCQFNRAGDIIAASDNAGHTKLFRVSDGTLIRQVRHSESEVNGPGGETNAIAFSADDQWMVTGMNDTGAKIWDLSTGEMIKNLGRGTNTDGAAFSPNGEWLAIAEDEKAVVYRLSDFEKLVEIPHPTRHECNSIDWSEDSSLLLTGSDGAAAIVTRSLDWKPLYQIDFGVDRVKSVRFSPDTQYFAVAGQRQRCRIYEVTTGKLVADLQHDSDAVALPGDDDDGSEPNIEAVEWSPDSRFVLTGGPYDGVIRVWRVADWSLVGWAQGQEYSRQVEFLDMSSDNLLAASGDEGYVYLLRLTPPVERPSIEQASSPDGVISIEAEDFDISVPGGEHQWQRIADATASGETKVQALPDRVRGADSKGDRDKEFMTWDPYRDSPRLDYRINFSMIGTYYVWTRAKGTDVYANSYHVGLNGIPLDSADRMENDSKEWLWDSRTKDGIRPTIEIFEPGPAILNVWMREDGVEIDKIILVRDRRFKPKQFGPEVTPRSREPHKEEGRFVYAHPGFAEKQPITIPGSSFTLHQVDRPQPPRVVPSKHSHRGEAPSDAVVLFEGSSMEAFEDNNSWRIRGDVLIAGSNFLRTVESFGDCQLHVEWRAPAPPSLEHGLGRLGNSGIVLMGLYEVQIYDSYSSKIYPDGSAAAIYGQSPPSVNAMRGPGEWQQYDIIFRAPRFENGKLVEPARITVLHNGVLVQNHTEILGPTAHRKLESYQAHEAKLPLALKGERSPVEFRNIWIRQL
jgi:WD40 repeat protein